MSSNLTFFGIVAFAIVLGLIEAYFDHRAESRLGDNANQLQVGEGSSAKIVQ